MSEGSRILENVICEAAAEGIIVVGAAGNNGAEASVYVPGGIDEAVIVGAAKENGERNRLSNYGDTVDYNIVADSTSVSAAKMSGWLSVNSPERIREILNQGFIYATDYADVRISAEVGWGKGTVEKIGDRIYSVVPEEGYQIWRTAGLNEYLDYFQPVTDERGFYVLDPAVKTFRVYFISDAEYEQILQSAGAEENLKYYWDNPQWFFRYGTKVLSDDEFGEVYGEYYARQADKKKNTDQFEAAWTFGVPAGLQTISEKLTYTPRVGQTLTAEAYGLAENNRQEGVDDTWNDYVFSISSGYGAGQNIHMNCSQNGGWFPISNGRLDYKITYVDTQTCTFGGNVYWESFDSREQPQANTFQGSYVPPNGFLTLVKSSAVPSVTEENRCYSLEGRIYGLP